VETDRSTAKAPNCEKVEVTRSLQYITVSDIPMTDCPICYTAMTPTTGSTTLGCSHSFHLTCIVGWFQEQAAKEETNTCPCCRRAAGDYDALPLPSARKHDEDVPAVLLLLPLASLSVRWIRYGEACWMTSDGMELWLSEWSGEAEPPPSLMSAMLDATRKVQSLWRGFRVRREVCAAKILMRCIENGFPSTTEPMSV
jgi:hypothetical protein